MSPPNSQNMGLVTQTTLLPLLMELTPALGLGWLGGDVLELLGIFPLETMVFEAKQLANLVATYTVPTIIGTV